MSVEITDELRAKIRNRFPALATGTVFLENAGGSQVPREVADRIRSYLLESYVQVGAGHELSRRATEVVHQAHDMVRTLMGGEGGEVILGPSTSALLQMLAGCYQQVLRPGQEVVVAQTGHEANVGPWTRLEPFGIETRWWEMNPESFSCSLDQLSDLLSERTALVAFPQVSNLLGEIVDVPRITALAHDAGARVVVDGVAYAPHRAMRVADWGVDWYAYSAYKVYGPHMAALWGREDALRELTGPNHFFIRDTPYRFELGGVCHEGCAGLLGLSEYLSVLAAADSAGPLDRSTVERAFEIMTACEAPLQARLLEYLRSKEDVRIIGPQQDGRARVGTISFVHARKSSRAVTEAVDRTEIAIRHGHMYAYRLCEALGLDPDDGVVRISLVHYNTPEEIERLIEVLDEALD
jgi:cysteine desulfurase family protein (TIGR01976 family)